MAYGRAAVSLSSARGHGLDPPTADGPIMELPDEAISYNYQGLMAPALEEWTAAAELRQRHFASAARFKELQPRLQQVRGQIASDRELRNAPPDYLPLEAGFINLPQELLEGFRRKQTASELGHTLTLATRLREESDRVVFLGAGGPILAARAFFQALRSAHHNELPPETRLGVPRVYFDGHSADNDALQELLDLLQVTCVDPEHREERWSVVALGKSGTTLEPAIALRVFRREAAEYYGLRSPWLTRLFAAATGPATRLRELFRALGIGEEAVLTIPDNVGSRFSTFTPAGLLPAALLGLDVRALLLGAAAMTRRFLEDPIDRNPVLQFAGLNYLMAQEMNKPLRLLAVWSGKLEGVGRWYEGLVAETLGKQGGGPTPLTAVLTRDLHVRGQQLLEGTREAVLTNLVVKNPQSIPIVVQMADRNEDELNALNRRSLPDITLAALKVFSQTMWDTARPSADLVLPALSEHTIGQLMQMLMLATVVEARLRGVNPYSQPASEGQRRGLVQALAGMEPPPSGQGSTKRP